MKRKYLNLLIISFLLISCSKPTNNNFYPIEEQKNNIVLHLNNEGSPYDGQKFTLIFFMSDSNYRYYDTTFSFQYDIDTKTSIDIRIVENKLIITNLENISQQNVIDFTQKLPDIFNDNTKNAWIIKDLRNEAIQHFSEYYGLYMSTYLKSFKITNNDGICFDVFIRSQQYLQD